MANFKFIKEEDLNPHPHKQMCAIEGCSQAGEHKAPRSPLVLDQYQWLCIDHVREFNKQWDYFKNMSQSEIEEFQKDAVTGHRPTWRMNQGDKYSVDALNEAVDKFMGIRPNAARRNAPPINKKDRQALSDLDLDHPCSAAEVKSNYKKLVKQYHPDRNQGDKDAEERFKQITASYNYLMQRYVPFIQE